MITGMTDKLLRGQCPLTTEVAPKWPLAEYTG